MSNIELKELRLKKGWSHATLAYAAGVSKDTIRRLENGAKISPESLTYIEEALNETNN